jgi:hypothetical protein
MRHLPEAFYNAVKKSNLLVICLVLGCKEQNRPMIETIHRVKVAPLPSVRVPSQSVKSNSTGLERVTVTVGEGTDDTLPDCITSGVPLPSDIALRLSAVETRCSGGLTKTWTSSIVRGRVTTATPPTHFEFHKPICLRLVAITDDSNARIRAAILDESGRVLVKNRGLSVVTVPNRGTLCLPEGTRFRLEVDAANKDNRLLAALLTSQ